MSGSHATDSHNQPPLLEDCNTYLLDQVVQDAVAREGAATAHAELEAVGAWCGSAEALLAARQANAAPPQLRAYDAAGRRLDRVEFHPAYHTLMRESAAVGLQGRLWEHLGVNATRPQGAYVARAAALYLTAGLDCGHLCPLSMTSAAVPALKSSPDLLKAWLPRIITRAYDPRHRPAAAKSGITLGMAITERQGGSDMNVLATRAEPAASVGEGACLLKGHKWFVAAPMSDGFLILAEAAGGLTAVLVPRLLPDGQANGLHLLRLKDTLGNRANATAEIALHDTIGWRIGEAGRGVSILMEMVTETRLDCAIASAGLMRAALAEAVHFTRHRRVRGERLIGLPLMRHVLADLALDVEAAVAVVFRLARAFDRVTDQRAAAWRRLMTPVVKYWTTKVAPAFIAEAMECLGGNGYVEDSRLPRLYREAPVNAIWDGAGNVMGLDVLRVLKRHPETAEIVIDDLRTLSGDDPLLKQALVRVEDLLHEPRELDLRARTLAEQLAHLSAAVVLRAHAPGVVADAFITTRLAGAFRQTYGQGLEGQDTSAILARVLPE
jgi:putative acyl-CoA dehydrogenase